MDLGLQLDSSRIEQGLRELNPDLNFDVANRLEEWNYLLEVDPRVRRAIEEQRQPVLWRERYICSLDRGMVSEYKVWSLKTVQEEVPADESGDMVNFERVGSADWTYRGLAERVTAGDKSCRVNSDGTITRFWTYRPKQIKNKVLRLGWRHTFENLLLHDVPGVTRESIAIKFRVDMYKHPVGPPEELVAALSEE